MATGNHRGARLGQHFLTARWAAVALARAASVREGETIIEIGPGKGALTRELLATTSPIIAIEKDLALVEKLHETFALEISNGQLRIIAGDVRDCMIENEHIKNYILGNYVVAANIPYYITGEIIRQFLTATTQPRAMALLIQKEVAQRITSKKESILSLSVKAYGTPKIIEKVSRKSFSPAPSVDSAILLIEKISRDFFADVDEERFFAVVHAGFASKRKFLANNLAVNFNKTKVERALVIAHIDQKERAENVSLVQWKLLTQTLIGMTPS